MVSFYIFKGAHTGRFWVCTFQFVLLLWIKGQFRNFSYFLTCLGNSNWVGDQGLKGAQNIDVWVEPKASPLSNVKHPIRPRKPWLWPRKLFLSRSVIVKFFLSDPTIVNCNDQMNYIATSPKTHTVWGFSLLLFCFFLSTEQLITSKLLSHC